MRRIKSAVIKRLALCKRGKNGMTTLFKAEGGQFEMSLLTKADGESGELLAVMWAKGILDSDGDFSDTDEAISSMSSSFIQNGGALDLEHDGVVLSKDAAYVTEIFTIQKSDDRFANWKDYQGKPQDVSGGVAVKIQIDDPDLRESYRSGEWDGVSVFGPAAVEHVDLKAASKRVAAQMGSKHEMTKEEMQAALDASNAKMVDLFKSALAELTKTEAKPTEAELAKAGDDTSDELKAPVFEGSARNVADLEKFESDLRAYEMQKAILSGDLDANGIAEMRKAMTAGEPSVEDLKEFGAKEGDSKEMRRLQTELFKAAKASNVAERAVETNGLSEQEVLAKAEQDEGLEIAKLMNGGATSGGMRIVG